MSASEVPAPEVVVFGQLARDLVLVVDEMPSAGGSAAVTRRRELLGGKGANQAVALSQLGLRPALCAVAGDDDIGTDLIGQAEKDGIDTGAVVRRPDTATALIVDIVDAGGRWRYLEEVPRGVQLTESDVARTATRLTTAAWASVQLQQPARAAVAAVRAAKRSGCSVMVDGAPEDQRDEILAHADVVRADAREAELLSGTRVGSEQDAREAAAEIMSHGPGLVALAVGDQGNYFAWPDGEILVPLTGTEVVDTTGAGDALTAALIAGLASGYPAQRAARLAVEAAGATVGHPGGRPDLTGAALARQAHALNQKS